MSFTRQYYVSEENHRKLVWLVKSGNQESDSTEPRQNCDKLLNTILGGFFDKNYPELDGFIKRRSEIDSEAAEAIRKKDPTNNL